LEAGNSMWPHAVRHATVARNRVLTKVADDMWVPLERQLKEKELRVKTRGNSNPWSGPTLRCCAYSA
ncbi:hypothetical protein CLOP_g13210, partial [Closterium sp. NIES-67]